MIVETETGSQYEFNLISQQMRRLKGRGDPSPRVGQDGVWKTYSFVSDIQVGEPVMIIWPKADTPLLPDTQEQEEQITIPATTTSRVIKIFQEGDLPS